MTARHSTAARGSALKLAAAGDDVVSSACRRRPAFPPATRGSADREIHRRALSASRLALRHRVSVSLCVCRKTRRGRVERREVTMSDARACNHHVLRQSGSPRLRHRTTWVSHSTTRRGVRIADIPIRLWSHQSADCRGTSGPDLWTTSWSVAGTVRKYSQKVFKYKKNQNWILYFKYKIQ